MKTSISKFALALFLVMGFSFAFAQAPQKMSYQAVIRNAGNNLVANSVVGMRISILQGSASGTAVYVETQNPTTNINGLASIQIGNGTVVSGTFAAINWSSGVYYVKTETDPAGGTAYSITGTTQLLSVPYALYAEKVKTELTDFSAYASTTQTLASSGYVDFGSEHYDDGNLFAANQYTVPGAGTYHFDAHVRLNGDPTAGQYMWVGIYVNGNLIKDCTSQTSTNTYGINISADYKCNAGDVVKVWLQHASGPATIQSGTMNTWFNGHKIH